MNESDQNTKPTIVTRLVNYGNLIMGDNTHMEAGHLNIGLPGETRTRQEAERRLRRALNKSYIIAQMPPGLLCLLPIILPNVLWQSQHPMFIDLPVLWKGGLYFILIAAPSFGISYVVVFISYAFEKRIFPTLSKSAFSYLVTYTNSKLSAQVKDRFRKRYSKTFNEELPTAADEENDIELALTEIGKVATKVKRKAKDSRHLRLLRVRYQFTRNSIAAAKVGLILGFGMIVYSLITSDTFTVVLELKLLLFYFIILLQQRKLLIRASENYTVQMIRDFNQHNH